MNTTRKIAVNTGVQIIGRIVFLAISVISIAATTRYLGATKFGYFTTATAYVAVLTIFTDLGLSVYLVKQWAGRNERHLLAQVAGLKLVLSIITIIVGSAIFHALPYANEAKQITDLMLLGLLTSALTISWLSVFQAELRTPVAVYWDTLGRLVSLMLLFYAISSNYGLPGVVVSGLVGPLISSGLYYLSLRKYQVPAINFTPSAWPKLLRAALPLGVVGILNTLYFRFDMFILSLFKPAAEVGVYGISYKVYETITVFGSFFVLAIFPILAKYSATDKKRLRAITGKALDFLILLGVPASAGVILLAEPLIGLVGGSEFLVTTGSIFGLQLSGVLSLQLLAFGIWISFIIMLMGQLFIAEGLTSTLLRISLVAIAVNISLNFMLIPSLTYVGAAISTTATEILIFGLFTYKYNRYFGFPLHTSVFGKVLVATVIMSIAVLWLEQYGLIVGGIGGLLAYGLSVIVLRAITPEQVKELIGPQP